MCWWVHFNSGSWNDPLQGQYANEFSLLVGPLFLQLYEFMTLTAHTDVAKFLIMDVAEKGSGTEGGGPTWLHNWHKIGIPEVFGI